MDIFGRLKLSELFRTVFIYYAVFEIEIYFLQLKQTPFVTFTVYRITASGKIIIPHTYRVILNSDTCVWRQKYVYMFEVHNGGKVTLKR
jgi:hypothetical protein